MGRRSLAVVVLVLASGCMGVVTGETQGKLTCASSPTRECPPSDLVAPPAELVIDRALEPSDVEALACRHATLLFINFEGAELTGLTTCNSAPFMLGRHQNGSTLSYPAFVGSTPTARESEMQAIVARVGQIYAGHNVEIVTTRPLAGSYTMAMVGGVGTLLGGTGDAGLSLKDCDNGNPDDIIFAFTGDMDPATLVRDAAIAIAHETGHAFGLGHVPDPNDIMYHTLDPRQSVFGDQLLRVTDVDGNQCSSCTCDGTQRDSTLLNVNLGTPCLSN
jgi:hypothetical protein